MITALIVAAIIAAPVAIIGGFILLASDTKDWPPENVGDEE